MTTTVIRHSPEAADMESIDGPQFSPTLSEALHDSAQFSMTDSSPALQSGRSSPPIWRAHSEGPIPTGWFTNVPSLSPGRSLRSKSLSPEYHDATEDAYWEEEDTYELNPYKIPLPESPVDGRSPSPSPVPECEPQHLQSPGPLKNVPVLAPPAQQDEKTQENFFRMRTSIDIMQRTEPIEAAIGLIRSIWQHSTKNIWRMLFYSLMPLLMLYLVQQLTKTPSVEPMPDIVGIANSIDAFHPGIAYSESSAPQIEVLEQTGWAVWDLGESVRHTNMTGAAGIAKQLEELASSFEQLSQKLTTFFAHLGADIDDILHTMEWAHRELQGVATETPTRLDIVWANTHSMLESAGIRLDKELVHKLVGYSHDALTRKTVERVFHDFLNVMEEAISNELSASKVLYDMFESIDRQFLGLRRSTAREEDQQERLESEFLSSLWTKFAGPNANKIRKFQKNQALLASVKEKTTSNKHMLASHKQRLLTLKSNLAKLRQRFMSPLLAQRNSTQSIAQQIKGLDDIYLILKNSREQQKRKSMEAHEEIINRNHLPAQGIGSGR